MKRSTDRILTTHAGSLPRPDDLIELYRSESPEQALQSRLRSAVSEVLRRQVDSGIDVINDGEYGKAMRQSVDYGAWWSYVYPRLAGFEVQQGTRPGFGPAGSKDRADFREFYETGMSMAGADPSASAAARLASMVCVGPVSYVGHDQIRRDLETLKSGLAGLEPDEVFVTAVSPATLQILHNDYYQTPEDYTIALSEAIREEYRAIVDAGFILQIDDPALVDLYDWSFSNEDMAGYLKWVEFQVEAVNHALEGIPEDRVRFHICWGSWHGPHSTDVPLEAVADHLLKVNAQAYSIEAGNVRHEHEWRVWQDRKLPDGKRLIPGVVSHATNVLEHPELVADRIIRYANLVGRENVLAGTDCGLGGRIHPQLAWAKMRVLSEGAALASRQLWGRT